MLSSEALDDDRRTRFTSDSLRRATKCLKPDGAASPLSAVPGELSSGGVAAVTAEAASSVSFCILFPQTLQQLLLVLIFS